MKPSIRLFTLLLASIAAILAACVGIHEGVSPSTVAATATGDSSISKDKIIEDWSSVNPGRDTGTYTDALGSKIDSVLENGPDGRKASKLTSTLVQGGWCGIWRNISADLSKNTSFKFKVKSSLPGEVQISLRDTYNVQYTTSFRVTSKDWTEVTVPFSSFQKDPYYTPPDAISGHPMDLSQTKAMNLASQIAGDSVVEIGPIETVGTAPAAAASSVSNGKIIEDWFVSPFQGQGTFADKMGSKIDSVLENGPDGRKAIKLTSTLVQGGWCGIGRGNAADLSGKTAFKFKVKTSVTGNVEMQLRDAYNVQYIASFRVTSQRLDGSHGSFFILPQGPLLHAAGRAPGTSHGPHLDQGHQFHAQDRRRFGRGDRVD